MSTTASMTGDHSPVQRALPLVLEPLQRGVDALLLDTGTFVLGSADDCTLCIPIPGIQPRHCLITAAGGGATVEAIDSHTWLNEGPVRRAPLRAGDRLAIGPIEFRLRCARFDEVRPAGHQQHRSDMAQQAVPTWNHPDQVHSRQIAGVQSAPEIDDQKQLSETAEEAKRLARLDAELQERARLLDRKEAEIRDAADRQAVDHENQRRTLTRQENERTLIDREHASLLEERASLDSDRQSLRDLRTQVELQRHELETERQDWHNDRNVLNAANEELDQRHAVLDAESDRLEQLRTELQTTQSELAEQEADLDRRGQAVEAESAIQSDRAAEANELVRQKELLDAERHALEEDRQQWLSEAAQIETDRVRLTALEKQLADERISLADDTQRMSDQRSQIAEDRHKLDRECEEFSARKQDFDTESDRLEQLRTELQTTQSELAEQEADLELWRQTLDAESDRLKTLRAELQTTQSELTEPATDFEQREQTLEGEFTFQSDQAVEANELVRQKELLDAERHALEEDRQQWLSDAAQIETDRVRLTALEKQLADERISLADDTQRMSDQRDQYAEDRHKLDGERKQFEEEQRIATDRSDDLSSEHESSNPMFEENTPCGAETAEDKESEAFDLRTAISEMFDLPVEDVQTAADDVSSADREETDLTTESADKQVESMQVMLSSLRADEDTTRVSIDGDDAPADDQATDIEDPDSVAAYMERLLARSRRTVDIDPVPSQPSKEPQPAVDINSTSAKTDVNGQPEHPLASTTDDSAVQADSTLLVPPVVDIVSLAPAHRQDRDEVRAAVDSLRALANLSARAAITTHSRRKARGHLISKTLLAAVAFGLTVSLYTSVYWAATSYNMYGWSAALVCVIMMIELARSCWAASHTHLSACGSEQAEASIAGSSELSASHADDTTETNITPLPETMQLTSPMEQAPSSDRSNPADTPTAGGLVQIAERVED